MPVLQFRITETGKVSCERTPSRRIWRPHFFRSWPAKIGGKTFGFQIVLDGATSHLTAYPCESTCPSEVITKLHEWMDTFQMNPKAICADTAFHHLHDMQAFNRMHNVKRIPTGPHTPWPNRAEMVERLFKKFLLALVDTASKKLGPDHFGTNHSCPVDAQGSTGESDTGDQKCQIAHGIGHGTKTRRSPGPSFHESSERMNVVLPDLRAAEQVFYRQEDSSKFQQGRNCRRPLRN